MVGRINMSRKCTGTRGQRISIQMICDFLLDKGSVVHQCIESSVSRCALLTFHYRDSNRSIFKIFGWPTFVILTKREDPYNSKNKFLEKN